MVMKDDLFLELYEKPLALDEANAVIQGISVYDSRPARKLAISRYGFAIPCKEAIRALVGLSPLVEVGAGGGYYSRLLRASGADIVATDVGGQSKYSQFWGNDGILKLEAVEAVKAYPDRNVFVSWPSHQKPWAACMAKAMASGRVLAYIGEIKGCTADADFFDIMDSDFEFVEKVEIPKWQDINDCLMIARKK